MPLETVGIRAVIQGLQGYLAGVRQIQTVNTTLTASQQQLGITGARIAETQRISDEAYKSSRRSVAKNEEDVANRIIDAQRRVQRLTSQATRTDTGRSPAAQAAISARLQDAQIALDRVQRRGTASNLEAQLRSANVYTRSIATAAIGTKVFALAQDRANRANADAGNSLRRNLNAFAPFRAATNIASGATSEFGRALIATTGFSNRFAVSLRFGALALVAFSSAFTISEASKFESSLAKIDNLTNATREETQALGEQIKQLSSVLPKSPGDLGQAAYIILSSGIRDVAEGYEILDRSARAATAGFADVADVARATTSIINAYGKNNINAAQATEILFAGAREGAVEFNEFALSVGRLVPQARNIGIEFDQVAAGLAALTNAGLPAQQATTALLGILNQILDPSKEAEELLLGVGSSIQQLRKNVSEEGLLAGLLNMLDLFDNNINALSTLLPEVRGFSGALFLAAENGTRYNEVLRNIQNSSGDVDKAVARTKETFAAQAQILKNQLSIALINIGSAVLPALNKELKRLTDFLRDNQEDIKKFAENAIRAGALLIEGFTKGLSAISQALMFIPNNQRVIVAAIIAIGAGIVIALGPASAAFLAVMALVSLFGILSKESAKAELPQVGRQIGETEQQIQELEAQQRSRARFLPGSQAGQRESERVAGLQREIDQKQQQLVQLQERGRQLEELESEGLLGAAGNKTLQEARTAQEALNKSIADGRIELNSIVPSFNDVALAAKETGLTIKDALEDGIIDFAEAAELGINAVTAGALEASVIMRDAEIEAFNFAKTLSKVANGFRVSAEAANKLVQSLIRESLEKSRQALAAITGQPTKEVASLELALAQLEAERAKAALAIIPQIEALQDQLEALRARQRTRETKGRQGEPREPNEQILGQVLESGLNTNLGRLGTAAGESADALEAEEKAIQDQIDALQKQLEGYDRQGEAIQRQIDIYRTQTEILVKQAQLADKTLLSQEEQHQKLLEVIEAIGQQSQAAREFAARIGEDIIPEMNAMRDALLLSNGAIEIANKAYLRSADVITQAMEVIERKIEELNRTTPSNQEPKPLQHGGLITRPTLANIGEKSLPELVLPLSNPARSRSLLRSLPMATQNQLSSGGDGSIFGDLNIQGGPIPREVENMVVFQVRRQLAQTRNNLHRSGLRV